MAFSPEYKSVVLKAWRHGALAEDIGALTGLGQSVTPQAVGRWVKESGVVRDIVLDPTTRDVERGKRMARLYTAGADVTVIADGFDVTGRTVYRALHDNDVKMRDPADAGRKSRVLDPSEEAELVKQYLSGECTHSELARNYRISMGGVADALKRAGVNSSRRPHGNKLILSKGDAEKLCTMYKDGHTLLSIANQFNISGASVYNYLDRAGIPRRGKNKRHAECHAPPRSKPAAAKKHPIRSAVYDWLTA